MTPVRTLGSIVIAAHNEAAVIGRCLDSLGPVIESGLVQVVVVCNGCIDDTARIARSRQKVTVLELTIASKAAALRAGDRAAAAGPRVYLDADVVMTAQAVIDVIRRLADGPALAARPPIRFDSTDARRLVRSWYTIRERLPSIQRTLWGAGTYALSEPGRARFLEFPNVVSDDLFVDSLFSESEIEIVDTDPVTIRTPRTSADLLRILTRTYRTQGDVARTASGVVSPGQRNQLRDIKALVTGEPRLILAAVVYGAFVIVARTRARLRHGAVDWERDNSSRQGAAA